MALRTIIKDGDEVLAKKAKTVEKFDQKLWDLLDDMTETLEEANGLGLAAPQVGILRRVILVLNSQGELVELINPVIVKRDGEQDGLEGCLSVPGIWGYVSRPERVTVQAQNRHGEPFEIKGEGMVARCFCHEVDHLEGILYTHHCDKVYTQDELDEMDYDEENG